MRERLLLRHRITRAMRHYLDEAGFIDIETPMLSKATPEGARDYLVPSRTHAGKFFRSAAVAADLQAIADDFGFDATIKSCAVSATRICAPTAAGIHPTRYRDLVPRASQIQELMEGLVRHLFKQVLSRTANRCRG